jgi:plastocyanin
VRPAARCGARLGAVLGALLGLAAPARGGEVEGHVRLAVQGASLADAGPTIAWLEAVQGTLAYEVPARTPAIRQKDASFEPSFLVVAAGQTVWMPNDDTIFHNVFSYSRPNDFDLGLYPAGQKRAVTFKWPGVVRVYCSIHESMTALVLVTPSPWYDRVAASGEFRIRGVPAGRYRLRVWNERLPAAERIVEVAEPTPVRVEVAIGG